ncbi:MAG: 4-hydroxythreonine-4-phosphate dehydrogenase PdxA [bacterium]
MKIGITMGDPRGIGPEIIVRSLKETPLYGKAGFLLYGDSQLFSNFDLGPSVEFVPITRGPSGLSWTDEECGHASILYLEQAVRDALNRKIDAIVTAPICKAHIQKAGYDYPGHTEFLAEKTGSPQYVMMMASPALKVTLVTIHVPLKEVPSLLTPKAIFDTVKITFDSLKTYWGMERPRVAVCGLNPHAGEEGILGDEELAVIGPVLQRLRDQGYTVDGPAVPDAVFHQAHEGQYDAVVCMYHDQGLIPFKMLHFRDGVNVTLGLPIIRTSPDHGVAFDIVGKGLADPSSMLAAINLAYEMADIKKRTNHDSNPD